MAEKLADGAGAADARRNPDDPTALTCADVPVPTISTVTEPGAKPDPATVIRPPATAGLGDTVIVRGAGATVVGADVAGADVVVVVVAAAVVVVAAIVVVVVDASVVVVTSDVDVELGGYPPALTAPIGTATAPTAMTPTARRENVRERSALPTNPP